MNRSSSLLDFIQSQGVPEEDARLLAERKAKNPNFASVAWRGRMINLCLPSPTDGTKFNEMLASGNGPYLNTDSTFMEGTENGRQFAHTPGKGDAYAEACRRRGGSTNGRKYMASLARFPGDPEAWVGGRGDVQRICEQRGLGCEGSVTVKQTRFPLDLPPSPPIAVAEDILAEAVELQTRDKDLSVKEIGDITEKTRDSLSPSWKK